MPEADDLEPSVAEASGSATFADRLNHLFKVVHPAGRGPYNDREVADAITRQGHQMSHQYIWALRKGTRPNPTLDTIQALARFFGVPESYLVSGERQSQVDEQLQLLAAVRDADLREIMQRSTALSGPDRAAILRIIKGLSAGPADAAGGAAGDGTTNHTG